MPVDLSVKNLLSIKNVIETGVGETRVVALEDGSRIVLDTKSRLRIAFTANTRGIELLDGQAQFEVAKDPDRPFRVRTASAEVVAVGTKFDVATLQALTTVTLIEGRVNVRTISGTSQQEPKVEALVPGQQLGVASDDALAAINRYSETQIVIPGAALQSRRVSGVFRIGDVETEVIALQRYFGLKETSRSADAIVLERN
jgi:transmembrane sensor